MHARDLGTEDVAVDVAVDVAAAGRRRAGGDRALSGSPVRTDDAIRDDLLRLVECYTGEPGSWDARVDRGEVTVRRITGRPGTTGRSERLVVRALAHTVVGVISVRVPDLPRATAVIGIPA